MAFPKQRDLEIPMLEEIERHGGEALPDDLYEVLADRFGLTTEERQAPIGSKDNRNKWRNTVQWVRSNLCHKRGELDGTEKGIWRITPAGRARLQEANSSAGASKPKAKRNPPWSREELILALEIYLSHGLVDDRAPEVVSLSLLLRRLAAVQQINPEVFRNANGVAMKLGNFASLDPNYLGKGLSAGGKGDRLIWDEFANNGSALTAAATEIRLRLAQTNTLPQLVASDNIEEFRPDLIMDSRKRVAASIVMRRGQVVFRQALIQAYEGRCAFTGFDVIDALEAAHILAYIGTDSNHVCNGLLLRADLHTLFDLGLIAVETKSMTILLSNELDSSSYADLKGKSLLIPKEESRCPNKDALDLHRQASKCAQ